MARSDQREGAPRRRRSFLGGMVYWGAVLFVWGLIFTLAFLAVFAADLPDTSSLNEARRQPSVSYLDRSGALVSVRGSQYAPPVDLDKLPPYVPAAFVAIEDRWFYWHFGFNPWGIVRSQVYNLTHRGDGPLRGGSTITQQLARNLFLNMDQTYRRKAQELVLAVWLETRFTKKEILALYLNRVYFGAGAYGIEAASQRYFGKPAQQLTIGESALLAGMMKGPSRYSPVSSADRAARRATVVLNEMVRTRAITPDQRSEAIRTPVRVNPTLAGQRAQYFTDWVDDQVRGLVGARRKRRSSTRPSGSDPGSPRTTPGPSSGRSPFRPPLRSRSTPSPPGSPTRSGRAMWRLRPGAWGFDRPSSLTRPWPSAPSRSAPWRWPRPTRPSRTEATSPRPGPSRGSGPPAARCSTIVRCPGRSAPR